jgi:hypothetical protein
VFTDPDQAFQNKVFCRKKREVLFDFKLLKNIKNKKLGTGKF